MSRALIIFLSICVAVVVLSGIGGWLFFSSLGALSTDTATKPFTVTQGENTSAIAAHLRVEGLIKSPFAFQLYIWMTRVAGRLQAGEYALSPSMGVPTITRVLSQGKTEPREVTITIPEGWSTQQIGASLAEKKLLTKDEWVAAAQVTDSRTILPDATYSFLTDKPVGATLEGYLFPDTYRVFRDTAPAEVIRKMLDNFGSKVAPELIAQMHSQGKTLFEELTLASIVEKEVSNDADRRKVADVFLKRLRDGIPLQSDATVNYVTGKGTTRPSFGDLAVESPYNTYKHYGLPPGPIGNPGLSSILAVVNPEPNPYYYFLTTPSGDAVFSTTLEEHAANKTKYLSNTNAQSTNR